MLLPAAAGRHIMALYQHSTMDAEYSIQLVGRSSRLIGNETRYDTISHSYFHIKHSIRTSILNTQFVLPY